MMDKSACGEPAGGKYIRISPAVTDEQVNAKLPYIIV
jgi:hypothetical protein